tara:strand:- start:44 stop:451 length:408 start_codon:yes stop_codon:yes gene_type:complete
MNDEDLNLYAEKLILTSTTDAHIDGLANTFTTTTTTPNDTSGYVVTSGDSVSTNLSGYSHSNGSSNINTNWKLSQNVTPDVVNQTKEEQLEDVKDILNSVQRALDGLKTQVQVLSSSIEDENELKHKRRKLGGNE